MRIFSRPAIDEIGGHIEEDGFDADYGFQSEWEDDETDQEDLELKATTLLFDSLPGYPGQEENIERFCIPLFAKNRFRLCAANVLDSFRKCPAMT